MPTAALHQCANAPRCRALTDRKFCVGCQPADPETHRWDTDRRPTVRMRGRKLQAARLRLWAREPRCRRCRRLLTLATMIRDHIVNLADGGLDDETNTQPLCQGCSDLKTTEESKRGRRRGWAAR